MVNSMIIFFNIAIQHGCIAVHTQVMGILMYAQPACSILLCLHNLFPDFRCKYFGTAAG